MENSSKLLKVTGILMIIFGSLAIIFGIIGVFSMAVIAEGAALLGIDPATLNTGLLMLSSIIALVAAVVQLIAGIIGVKSFNKPEKATVCIVFGVLISALTILGFLLEMGGGLNFGGMNLVGLFIGLVIPVLYLIGAFQLKKFSATPPAVPPAG